MTLTIRISLPPIHTAHAHTHTHTYTHKHVLSTVLLLCMVGETRNRGRYLVRAKASPTIYGYLVLLM